MDDETRGTPVSGNTHIGTWKQNGETEWDIPHDFGIIWTPWQCCQIRASEAKLAALAALAAFVLQGPAAPWSPESPVIGGHLTWFKKPS